MRHQKLVLALLVLNWVACFTTSGFAAELSDQSITADVDIVGNLKVRADIGGRKVDVLNNSRFGSSFILVQVDGVRAKFGSADGKNVKLTYQSGTRLITEWEFRGVLFLQEVTLIPDRYNPKKSLVRIAAFAENRSDTAKKIGFRIVLDVQSGSYDKDLVAVPGKGLREDGVVFRNGSAPSLVYCIPGPTSADSSWMIMLHGSDLTLPDELYVSPWKELTTEKVLRLTDSDLTDDFSGESAVGLYWAPKTLQPKSKDGIAVAVGLPGAAVQSGQPVNSAFLAPETVNPGEPFWVSVQLQNEDRFWDVKKVQYDFQVDGTKVDLVQGRRTVSLKELERTKQTAVSWKLQAATDGKCTVSVRVTYYFKSKKITINYKRMINIKKDG